MKFLCSLLIPFFTLGIISAGCNFSPTRFCIDNNSSYQLDSVTIYFNKYEVRFLNVPPGETQDKLVTRDSVSSGHDIFITGRVITRDTVINVPFTFNDLGGSYDEIRLVINKDLKTIWAIKY